MQPAMRLGIFATHVMRIATAQAPDKFTLATYIGMPAVTVEITPNKAGPEWDYVRINGKCVGNRCGGVQELTRIINEAKPELQFD